MVGLKELDTEGEGLDDLVLVIILVLDTVLDVILEGVFCKDEDIVVVAVDDFELVFDEVMDTVVVDVLELLAEPVIVAEFVLLLDGNELTVIFGLIVLKAELVPVKLLIILLAVVGVLVLTIVDETVIFVDLELVLVIWVVCDNIGETVKEFKLEDVLELVVVLVAVLLKNGV